MTRIVCDDLTANGLYRILFPLYAKIYANREKSEFVFKEKIKTKRQNDKKKKIK